MKHVRPALLGAAGAALLVLTTTACGGFGPADKEEVCTGFDELNTQFVQGNGVMGNPLFRKTEEMADLADRYEGTPDLSKDAEGLHKVADADSMTGADLAENTTRIAELCDRPVGFGTGFGF
ncbi:molybdenum ABC transporter substrate-binding protein [Streptomyces sp. NPDC005899]|uniref:molybdenum ABC transporter substrate-binding protein n=1 Tax=Streptomyces sp. NPDC005899 TaxID=3155716 RepID=UPI00340D2DED